MSLYGVLQDMKDHDIDACYQLNVLQLIRLCRYFVDVLRQSDNGRIIVISSIWGETGASMETIFLPLTCHITSYKSRCDSIYCH
jgi:3-oxoacyl-[acyl-carrier protein] reductase